MKKLVMSFVLVCLGLATMANAQTSNPAKWPVCHLGAAPIAPGPAPTEAQVFKTMGGPVVMSEAGPAGSVRLVRCRLAPGTEVYRGADGELRDLPSNQPFWPVGWDAVAPAPIAQAVRGIRGKKGEPGAQGIQGLRGEKGDKGDQGEAGRVVYAESPKKGGFWHSKKAAILIAGTVAAVGGGIYYYEKNRRNDSSTAVATVVITLSR